MKRPGCFLLSEAITVCAASEADANWSVSTQGPDVFGNTTVIAVDQSVNGDGLVIQCNQKDTLEVALLVPATPSELDQLSKNGSPMPATFLIKVDNSPVTTLNDEGLIA
jgi:hypothetical protein